MTEMSALGIRVTGDGITKTTAELDAFTAAAIKAAAAASKPINTAGGGGGAAALTAVTTATKSLSSAQVTATATTQGASGALHEMAAKIAATEAALSRQTAAEKAAAAATASHASSLGAVSPALAAYAARATAAATTSQKITAVAGQQKQGLQQLSFQINDVATQFASGTPPMQIFAQQAGQTVQAIQLMVGGAGKLAAFLSGPWGIAVVAATVVLVPFIGKLFDTADAANGAAAALRNLVQARADDAASASVGGEADRELRGLREQARVIEDQIAMARRNSGNATGFQNSSAANKLFEINLKILDIEDAIGNKRRTEADSDNANMASAIANRAKLAGATSAADRAQAQYSIRVQTANEAFEKSNKSQADQAKLLQTLTGAENDLNKAQDAAKKDRSGNAAARRAENLAREAVAVETLTSGLYEAAEAYRTSASEGARLEIVAQAVSQGIKKRADQEAFASREMAKALAQRSVEAAKQVSDMEAQAKAQEFVNAQVNAGVIDASRAADALSFITERRSIETSLAAAATANDAKAVASLTVSLAGLEAAQLRTNKALTAAADIQRSDSIGRQIEDVKLETRLQSELGQARLAAMRGLNGQALEDELLNIGAAHEKAAIGARAEADAAREVALGHTLAAEAILRKAEADKTQVDVAADIERQNVALSRQAEILGSLNSLSSGPLGGILGALTSNNPVAGLIGSGGIGSLLGLGTNGGRKAYQEQADAISSSLEKVFGVSGVFAKTLAGAIQGSSLGSLGGGLVGLNNAGSSIGGALGGALMSGGLGKSITKGLTGAFGSAIGGALSSAVPILGGIAGGLLGNLLKKDQYGSTTVTGAGVQGSYGNNSDARSGSGSLANSLQSTLSKLASSLDVTLGKFEVSLGVTNGKINVNPGAVSGMIGTTKQSDTIDFGKDEAAALKYAIQNAIEDGALAGLSEGWKKFLLYSDDIEGQFTKLSNLQSAYNELDSIKDPQAYALKALDKTFAELRETAYRAGDDLARVEELYQLKRKDIIETVTNDSLESERAAAAIRVDRLSVEGKTEEALALARQLQIDAADALAQAEYRQLYTAQDAATAAQKLADAQAEQAAAADRVIALQIRLSRAGGDDVTAKALERMQELNSAQSDQERSMLQMIYATDDLMEKQSAAAAGMEAWGAILDGITSGVYAMTKSLREFADGILGREDITDAEDRYRDLVQRASRGDQDALGKLPDAINAYLEQAKGASSSLADYQLAAAYARQTAYDVADVADAQVNLNAANFAKSVADMRGEDTSTTVLSPQIAALAAALAKLNETTEAGNKDRIQLGVEQIYATKEGTRILDDATEGGYAIKTQPAP